MKTNELLQEAPLDFAKGVASSLGRTIGRTAPVRGIRNVIGAGQAASHAADTRRQLQKLVQQFVQHAHMVIQQTPKQAVAPQVAPAQQPAQQPPQPPAQQSPQRQAATGSPVPDAFRTTQRPKYVGTPHGPALQFSSFLMSPSGKQLDEAWRDFVAGAGKQIGQDVQDKANQYWKSVLAKKTDSIVQGTVQTAANAYRAGKDASVEADTKRALRQQQMAHERMKQLGQQIKAMIGDNPQVQQQVAQLIAQSHKDPNDPRIQQVIKLLHKA